MHESNPNFKLMENTQKQIKELLNKYDNLKVEYNTLEEETTEDIKQLKKLLEWYDNFVDYVQECNTNIYNSACIYADDTE
jgi:DNA-binding transcriptional regulator GbsR (MarR family)